MLHLVGKYTGETVAPLERIVIDEVYGTLHVADSLGREYVSRKADGQVAFLAGGAAGWHSAWVSTAKKDVTDTIRFLVKAETKISDKGGRYAHLMQMLFYTMVAGDGAEYRWVTYKGRLYYCLISWLRDHVHVMKGMKYFEARLKDGIDLFRDSQREDGMIWDNWHKKWPENKERDHWGARFYYGDFYRDFPDYSHIFTRIPVENDVEYLFVEGLYYTWKATGDDGWMADGIDHARRALDYSVSSPYRWSEKYQLLKRGHTIDTWDFQNDADCLADFAGWPDPMAVHPDKTQFGIMFGDNTGYAMACEWVAEMLENLGRQEEASLYRTRGQAIRRRINEVSWNGRFFTHHVPEQDGLDRDLGVDENDQVSLSNAYSLNRELSHEQCKAIIQTYQRLKDGLPPGSPGEWYTIYPPFKRGYAGHNGEWQYMNASVTPIVAGELAHGAFQHGFEKYGVDILDRLLALGENHGGTFHSSYTGAFPPLYEVGYFTVDLRLHANVDTYRKGAEGVPGWTGEGSNGLEKAPKGMQTLAGIPFDLINPVKNKRRACIGVSHGEGYLQKVEIPIGKKAASIYWLHALAHSNKGRLAGNIRIQYEDGSSYEQVVSEGQNALPWNHWIYLQAPDEATTRIAWRSYQPGRLNVQLVAYGLDNPTPEKTIQSLVLEAGQDEVKWFVLGITLSDQPVRFPATPISFGIPNGWSAAAVVYALVEGLAGVVDHGVSFNTIRLEPRWKAAKVDKADVTIHYPASNGYVAYRYEWVEKKKLQLIVTGSGSRCDCHVWIPSIKYKRIIVCVDNTPVEYSQSQVEDSTYLDFQIKLPGPVKVKIELETR